MIKIFKFVAVIVCISHVGSNTSAFKHISPDIPLKIRFIYKVYSAILSSNTSNTNTTSSKATPLTKFDSNHLLCVTEVEAALPL